MSPFRFALPLACLVAIIGFADPAPCAEPAAAVFPVIEVTAVGEQPSADTTTSTSVYDASLEVARVKTVSEALDTLPSVRVKDYGGADLWSVAYIRGFAPNQTAVLIDGVPVNSAIGGAANLASIPAWNVSRVEVYKGFTPAVFPVSAPGGVINIVTSGVDADNALCARAGYGSFNTYSADASVDHPLGSGGLHITGGAGGSAGDFPYLNNHGTDHNTSDDSWDLRKNNRSQKQGLTARITQKFAGWDAELSDGWFRRDSGLPGIGNNQSDSASIGLERNIARLAASGELGEDKPSLAFDAFHLTEATSFKDLEGEIGLGAHDSVGRTAKTGAGLDIRFGEVWIAGGASIHASHSRETYQASDRAYPENPDDPARSRYISAVSVQSDAQAGKWIIAPSLRYERFDDQFGGPSFFQEFSAPFSSSAVHETFTPKIGFRRPLFTWLSFIGNVGLHQRVPDLMELFGDRGVVVGNPSLVPEKGASIDIGLRSTTVNAERGIRITGDLVFFHSETRDLIAYTQNSQRTSIAQNVGSAVINGVELSATARFDGDIRASLAYTWQEARDTSDVPYYNGRLLPDRPVHDLFVKAVKEWENTLVFYEFSYEDGLYLDRANFMKNPSQAIHNAGATLMTKSSGDLSLTFEVKNITNQQAWDAIGYPMPGTSFFLTVELRPRLSFNKDKSDGDENEKNVNR